MVFPHFPPPENKKVNPCILTLQADLRSLVQASQVYSRDKHCVAELGMMAFQFVCACVCVCMCLAGTGTGIVTTGTALLSTGTGTDSLVSKGETQSLLVFCGLLAGCHYIPIYSPAPFRTAVSDSVEA